jgi:phage-related tail fiber protein
VSVIAGDRVLVKNQTTGSENGIYVVAAGSWTRATDFDSNAEVTAGAFTFVEAGTVNGDSGFVLSTDNPITLGTTALTFVQFSGAGQITAGNGMTKTGNSLDIVTASAARIVVNADSIDLATAGTAGTYRSVTTDAYGRVTAGTNPTTLSGYGITDAQPLDATLTALAGVTVAADKLVYATGTDAFATTDLSAFGRSLIDDANNGAARTTLGLGTIATQDASNVTITGGSIDNITLDGGTF